MHINLTTKPCHNIHMQIKKHCMALKLLNVVNICKTYVHLLPPYVKLLQMIKTTCNICITYNLINMQEINNTCRHIKRRQALFEVFTIFVNLFASLQKIEAKYANYVKRALCILPDNLV